MAPQAFELAQSASELRQGATIGVVDTGVDNKEQDLVVVPDIDQCASVDANGQCDAAGTNTNDTDGHGTAVAGVAAAQTNNSIGAASPAYAAVVVAEKIYPPGSDQSKLITSSTMIANGIDDAIAKNAKIVNISTASKTTNCLASASPGSPPLAEALAIKYACTRNVLVVASAGNCKNDTLTYPAAIGSNAENLISVGATDVSDQLGVWPSTSDPGSDFGPWVNLYAPGTNICVLQSDFNSLCGYGDGTSLSAPLVAGAASMILGMNPSLKPADIKNILTSTADVVGLDGDQDILRRLNLYMAAKAVAAHRTPGDPLIPEQGDTSFPQNYAVPEIEFPECVGSYCKCPSVEYRGFSTVTIANSTFNNTPNYEFAGYRWDVLNFYFTAEDDNYLLTIPSYGFSDQIPQGRTQQIQFQLTNSGVFPIFVRNSAGVQTAAGYVIVSPYCK
jgi:hypothetical protein